MKVENYSYLSGVDHSYLHALLSLCGYLSMTLDSTKFLNRLPRTSRFTWQKWVSRWLADPRVFSLRDNNGEQQEKLDRMESIQRIQRFQPLAQAEGPPPLY